MKEKYINPDDFKSKLDTILVESSNQDPMFLVEATSSILIQYLQNYIVSFVPEDNLEDDQYAHIFFGSENLNLSNDPKLNDLTNEQKTSFIEAGRALVFINKFKFLYIAQRDWPPLAIMQIKLHALSKHLYMTALDPNLKNAFKHFFDKVLPLFPKDLKDLGLNLSYFDPSNTYGTFWYDTFIYREREKMIDSYEFRQRVAGQLVNDHYADDLNCLLNLPVDNLTQFQLIDSFWEANSDLIYTDETFIPNWINILKEYSNKGNTAAASWLVTATYHGDIKYQINALLSKEEHFTAIRNFTLFHRVDNRDFVIEMYFLSVLEVESFDNLTNEKAIEYINFIKSCESTHILLATSLFAIFMNKLTKERPDLIKTITQLKVEMAIILQSVINEASNPLLRDSEKLKQLIKDSSTLVSKSSAAEIKKNARLLAQGARDRSSLFSRLPDELLRKIASDTRASDFHTEEDANKIADEYLDKPNLKINYG